MSEDRTARDLGDLVVAYTDYNRLRWSPELSAQQQHAIESYFSNLQYLTRNSDAILREPAKLDAFKKTLSATVTHQVHDADPPRAEVSGFIGCTGLVCGVIAGVITAYTMMKHHVFPADYGVGALLTAGLGSYLSHRAYKASQVKQHAENYRALQHADPAVWSSAFALKSRQISEALGRFAEHNIARRAEKTQPVA